MDGAGSLSMSHDLTAGSRDSLKSHVIIMSHTQRDDLFQQQRPREQVCKVRLYKGYLILVVLLVQLQNRN